MNFCDLPIHQAMMHLRRFARQLTLWLSRFFTAEAGSHAVYTSDITVLFESYRGMSPPVPPDLCVLTITDDPIDSPDTIGITRAMDFLGDIGVQLDEVACLAVAEIVKSPSMGEFTRQGFVNGWCGVR